MNFDDLSDELKAKVRASETTEELMALAEQEGIELSDEQLEGIAGGGWSCLGYGVPTDKQLPEV